MTFPRPRRMWVAAAVVVLIGLGVVRLLDQPLELASYRAVDAQTVDVVGFGARTTWTHVTGLTESDTTVTISVNSFTFEPFPHTDAAYRIETLVRLAAPLGNRVVVDGSTGQRIPESAT